MYSETPTAAVLICPAVFAVLVPLLWWIATQNRFIRLRNLIRESWAGIGVELRRRHDLIPNLVECVRGYMTHEKELLERLVADREEALRNQQGPNVAVAENEMVRSANKVLAVAEGYPDLKASRAFLELQKQLANTEDRIAAARRFYNANVRDFNSDLETFPRGIVASRMSLTPAPFFETEPLEVPRVHF